MMSFFDRLLTPEARAAAEERREAALKKRVEIANLSDASLAATAQFYAAQLEPSGFPPGAPVYEATFFQIIMPEIIRRLERGGL